MRKQLNLKFWLLAMLFSIAGASPTWAEETTVTINYDDTFSPSLPTASGSVNSTATLHTVSGLAIKEKGIYKGSTASYIMFAQNKGYLYNTTSLGTIKSVAVTYSAGCSTSAKAGVYFGSTEQSTYTTTSNVTIKGQSKTDTWTNSTSGNGFFQLSTSNKNCQITTIVVTYETTPSFTLTPASNNDDFGTVSVEDDVITASPAEGYRVSTSEPYTITSGESDVSSVVQEGNTFTVTATGDCTVRINFEAIPTHTVTINEPTGGTLTVKNGDDVVSSGSSVREGTTLTIIPEADDSHRFNNWKANNGDANTDVFTYTMSTGDVTFSATFDEVVKYAVNWNVNGNVTTEYYEKDEDITFPTNVDNIEEKEFVGWSASTVTTTNTEPTLVSEATMETSALTYYAVFAQRTIGEVETKILEITNKDFTDNLSSSYSNQIITKTIDGVEYKIEANACLQSSMCQMRDNATLSYIHIPTLPGSIINVSTTDCQSPSAISYTGIIHIKTSKTRGNSDTNDIVKSSLSGATSFSIDVTGNNKSIYLLTSAGLRIADLIIKYNEKKPDIFSAYTTTVPLKYALTISNPTGGTIEVTDGGNPVASGDRFESGTALSIAATPATGYSFTTWTATAGTIGAPTNASTTFTTAESAATLSATFTLNTHSLSTTATNGSVAVTVDDEAWNGTDEIPYGATVSITATPNTNYLFSDWSSSDIDIDNTTTNPLVFTMPDKNVSVTATFANANTEYDITIASTIENGTVTASVAKAKSGDEVALTATPASGYIFDSWSVTDAMSNTVTVTNNKFTMPASNVTVNASFIRQYTITYHVAGEEQTVKRTGDEVLGLDDPEAIDGMPFAGWSVTNDLSNPSFADNSALVTSDMTLYAAFTAHAAVNEYQKVTATSEVTDGDYLIVYEEENMAFNGGRETLDAANNAIQVDISDNKIAATAETNAAVFTIDTENGKLRSASGFYIGVSSNDNALKQSENADEYTNSFSIDEDGNAVISAVFAESTMTLRYNSASNQNRFRYYKSGQQAIQLYKKVSTPAIYTFGETVSVSVTSAGYATYCSDQALDFSHATGLKAYIVTSDGSTTDYTEVTDAPANTGLLLKAAANDYEAYVVGTSTTDVTANKLVGVTSATGIYATTDGKTNFVLSNGTQGVGFYKVKSYNDGNPDFTVKANSAYLSVALVSNARESSFFGLPEDESETTGITMVQGERATTQGYYNLNGQRVSQPNRGLYIVNGKKIVIK